MLDSLIGIVLKVNNISRKEFIINNFTPWPNGTNVGTSINQQYASVTSQSVRRSYYDLSTDIGIFCPQVEIAQLYANSTKSGNVYVTVSWQPPAYSFYTLPGNQTLTDPFQLWDWIAATGSWDFFQVLSEAEIGKYSPNGQDVAYGALLRNEYFQFIANGTIAGHKRVNDNQDGSYSVIQLGSEDRNGTANDAANFRKDYCDLLKTSWSQS